MAKRKRRQPTRRTQDAPKTERLQQMRMLQGKRWRGVLTVAIFLGLGLATSGLWRGWLQPVRTAEKSSAPLTNKATPAVSQAPLAVPQYVGGEACRGCHRDQFQQWQDSHHAQAMQAATPEHVLGNFNDRRFTYNGVESRFYRQGDDFYVRTDGPEGALADYKIRYTFGVYPLQQYLIDFPGGRLQALSIAWDARPTEQGGQRWFHLYPKEKIDFKDQLHWTRPYQNWNMMCAACHSTALEKRWDAKTRIYDTRWQEISVSCEACHGPGSRHVEWAKTGATSGDGKDGFTVHITSDWATAWRFADASAPIASRATPQSNKAIGAVCAPCHARSGPLVDDSHSAPGEELTQRHRPALLVDPLFWPTGEQRDEVYVWNNFQSSKMAAKGVTCMDCHNPHTGKTLAEGNALCVRCHRAEVFATSRHHFHERSSAGAACVACHMPEETYMVIDGRRDHSFQTPRPDLSAKTGSPNACIRCHVDKDNGWAAQAMDRWYGEQWRKRPHWAWDFVEVMRGNTAVGSQLMELAKDPRVPAIVQASALSLAAREPRAETISAAKPFLTAENALIRTEALTLLEPLPSQERWRLANVLLSDPDRLVRTEAARVLADTPRLGLGEADRQRLDNAVNEYEEALRGHSDFPANATLLGTLYMRLGRVSDAEEQLRQAVTLDRQFVGAYINLADLYRQQNQDQKAVAMLLEGLQQAPQAADLHHALGLTYVRLGQTNEALARLQKAVELAPDNARYAFVYAVALHDTGAARRGIETLERILRRQPDNGEVLSALINWSLEQRDSARAQQYMSRFEQLHSREAAQLNAPER
jgi:predicted CXXCH cytochrome family protein